MGMGQFQKEEKSKAILSIAESIMGTEGIESIARICERYGEEEDAVREYDVYKIKTGTGYRILKKAANRELENYLKFLSGKGFRVPACYGHFNDGQETWIAIENIDGEDLRDMTDTLAVAAADSIAEIQNCFWNDSDQERFHAYMERIEKRRSFIQNEPVIGKAYSKFVERQKTCPRTLSNRDFMEFNAVYNGPSDPDHSYAKEREHGMIKKNRKGAQYHGTQTVHSAV